MHTKPLKVAGLVSLIMGILFVLTGAVTWGVVSSQLAAERITVPQDAAFSAGAKVQGPISALAQADTINKHALAGSNGMTYAELVDRIGVRRRQVGDDEVGVEQLFVHGFVDHA